MPDVDYSGGIHCVTRWSKFNLRFHGVACSTLLNSAMPDDDARHALVTSYGGYTASMTVEDLMDGQAMLAWEVNGTPIAPDHGGPVRLLVPHLYLWKSAKWIQRITIGTQYSPGFFERGGYHERGDPWLEERYLEGIRPSERRRRDRQSLPPSRS